MRPVPMLVSDFKAIKQSQHDLIADIISTHFIFTMRLTSLAMFVNGKLHFCNFFHNFGFNLKIRELSID